MKLQQITGLLLASFLLYGCRPAIDNSSPDSSATAPATTTKTPPPVTLQHRFQRIVLPPEEQSATIIPAGNNSTHPPNHDSSRWLFPRIMAGGCGIADLNQDHLPDLILIGLISTESPEHATALLQILQQQPDGSFQDVSQTAQLAFTGIPGGIAVGDFDNDGLSDLCLTGFSDCRLYRNLGNFHFADVTAATPLRTGRWSTSAAFLDFDRDGHLDLFITNYVDYDPTHHCQDAAGRLDFCSPSVFPRTTDRLFRNTGTAPWFEDVSATSGITRLRGAGLGVAAADWNNDGWIDIFVANDGHPNFLWINQQNGTFEEEAVLRGVAADAAGQSQGSMGVAVADLDGNLLPDLVVTNLDGESNSVCLNQAGSFQELSSAWQMDSSSWPFTGFGTALADLNHDGYTDFVAVHGRVRRQTASPEAPTADTFWDGYREQQLLLLGHNDHFEKPAGVDEFSSLVAVARGLASGDVDNDGDIDLLITCLDQPSVLLKNEMSSGHWLSIQPRLATGGQRVATGATVTITTNGQSHTAFLIGGGSYQSTCAQNLHFGLGNLQQVDQITIRWPDGMEEVFPGCRADQRLSLLQGTGTPAAR